MKRVDLYVSGGMGDVWLTRKCPVIYLTHFRELFRINSIAEVYNRHDFNDRTAIDCLFEDIKKNKLKGSLDQRVEELLKKELLNSSINYFDVNENGSKLPKRFLDSVGKNDVVDISVPNTLHYSLAEQVLRAGKNLLLEKPAVSCMDEAEKLEHLLKIFDLDGRMLMDTEHYSYYGNIRHYVLNFGRYMSEAGLGKVRKIKINIEEKEDFDNERNRNIIEIEKSGGGYWLDIGPHPTAFLRNIGAQIDYESIEAQPYKSHDFRIQDDKYGETAMDVRFNVYGGKHFDMNCEVEISVGKCCGKKNKHFVVEHKRGYVDMDVSEKKLKCYRNGDKEPFEEHYYSGDAFYYVYESLYNNVVNGVKPLTSLDKGIKNVKDIFRIYEKSKPLKHLSKGEHKFSALP